MKQENNYMHHPIEFALFPVSAQMQPFIDFTSSNKRGYSQENPPRVVLFAATIPQSEVSSIVHETINSFRKDHPKTVYTGVVKQLETFNESYVAAVIDTIIWGKYLQECLIEKSLPHAMLAETHATNVKDLSLSEINSLKKFGYPYAGDAFHPHIIVDDTEPLVLSEMLRKKHLDMLFGRRLTFHSLTAYTVDDGCVDKILATEIL
jgi:hypothetical protein